MIVYNEERIIEKTLSSIANLASEIVILDSFSTDNTLNILKKFNVRLYQEKWQGYAKQKNLALSKCSGDWILVLDADEIITESLKDEILSVIQKPSECSGFKIKRKLFIGDKWIKHGGFYPDYQLRLVKNSIGASFKDREVHESINLNGKIGLLRTPLEHYAYTDLKDFDGSLQKYSILASKEIKKRKFYFPFLRAVWAFGYRYFFRFGFLDGRLGFEALWLYSNYVYNKYKLASSRC